MFIRFRFFFLLFFVCSIFILCMYSGYVLLYSRWNFYDCVDVFVVFDDVGVMWCVVWDGVWVLCVIWVVIWGVMMCRVVVVWCMMMMCCDVWDDLWCLCCYFLMCVCWLLKSIVWVCVWVVCVDCLMCVDGWCVLRMMFFGVVFVKKLCVVVLESFVCVENGVFWMLDFMNVGFVYDECWEVCFFMFL